MTRFRDVLRLLNAAMLLFMFAFGFLRHLWDALHGRLNMDMEAVVLFGLITFAFADYLRLLWSPPLPGVILDDDE